MCCYDTEFNRVTSRNSIRIVATLWYGHGSFLLQWLTGYLYIDRNILMST